MKMKIPLGGDEEKENHNFIVLCGKTEKLHENDREVVAETRQSTWKPSLLAYSTLVAVETPLWVLSFAIFIFAKRVSHQTPSLSAKETENKWLKTEQRGSMLPKRVLVCYLASERTLFACGVEDDNIPSLEGTSR